MVILDAQVPIKPEARERWLALLDAVTPPSRAEDACPSYVLYEAIETPNTFISSRNEQASMVCTPISTRRISPSSSPRSERYSPRRPRGLSRRYLQHKRSMKRSRPWVGATATRYGRRPLCRSRSRLVLSRQTAPPEPRDPRIAESGATSAPLPPRPALPVGQVVDPLATGTLHSAASETDSGRPAVIGLVESMTDSRLAIRRTEAPRVMIPASVATPAMARPMNLALDRGLMMCGQRPHHGYRLGEDSIAQR